MNGIAGLLRENRTQEAAAIIAGLSDLLRRVLLDSGRHWIPLGEELEFLERYIGMQSTRFGERLKVNLDVPHGLRAALIPPLILEPLVEKAIVHGVGKRIDGGAIRIAVKEGNGSVAMSVTNDGPPMTVSEAGVGISNIGGCLAMLYGNDYTFDLRNRDDDCVEAVIKVPYLVSAS